MCIWSCLGEIDYRNQWIKGRKSVVLWSRCANEKLFVVAFCRGNRRHGSKSQVLAFRKHCPAFVAGTMQNQTGEEAFCSNWQGSWSRHARPSVFNNSPETGSVWVGNCVLNSNALYLMSCSRRRKLSGPNWHEIGFNVTGLIGSKSSEPTLLTRFPQCSLSSRQRS